MYRYAVAGFVLLAACTENIAGPTPATTPQAITATPNEDNGPPSRHHFGRDSYQVGTFTGEGITPTGLSCRDASPEIRECEGFLASAVDRTRLDVLVQIPLNAPKPVPLVALIHGYGGGKRSSGDIAESLVAAGYAVLRYTTRGFEHSWGQVNMVDTHAEVADLRSMIAQVIDWNHADIDMNNVAVTGASYGGGHSWLAALQPNFTTPDGSTVRIKTVVPIATWSDLLYSLVPNGRERESLDHPGGAKLSYINGLYASGIRTDLDRPYPNYPEYFMAWHAWIDVNEPDDADPIFRSAEDGLAGYRSIWWQQRFWQSAPRTRLPIFIVQGFTDDLFPFPEAKRMVLALQTLDPSYPVATYLGDIGHPRASNKPGEVNYVLGLIKTWFAYYLKGQGSAPPNQVYAALTRPRDENFNSGNVLVVPNLDALATRVDSTGWMQPAVLVNPLTDPASGFAWDPLIMEGARELKPLPEPADWPVVSTSLATYDVKVSTLTASAGGGALIVAGQPVVTFHAFSPAYRVQLDVRLFDVDDVTKKKALITRGTYTLESSGIGVPLGDVDVSISTYGNYFRAEADHTLRLELTNVDSPYITPSHVPSTTSITNVKLKVPAR